MVAYQRPESLAQILQVLASEKFDFICIAIDGVDPKNVGAKERNERIRRIATDFHLKHTKLVQVIDRNENLGITLNFMKSVSLALTKVEYVCVLEDDCIPSPGFSLYLRSVVTLKVSESTKLYSLFRPNLSKVPRAAYYTHCPVMWGWMISRESWVVVLNDIQIQGRKSPLLTDYRFLYQGFLFSGFSRVVNGQKDAMDSLFAYIFLTCNYLALIPPINLISNIGTGELATNTKRNSFMFHTRAEIWSGEDVSPSASLTSIRQSDFQIFSKMTGWKLHRTFSSYIKLRLTRPFSNPQGQIDVRRAIAESLEVMASPIQQFKSLE